MSGRAWTSELRDRTCGFCGRKLYDIRGVTMTPVFSCGGCRTRWTPEGLETYAEEVDRFGDVVRQEWTKVPEGCLVAKEL